MNRNFLLIILLAFLSGCSGEINVTKLVQETVAIGILAAFAYSGGVLILGYLTDIAFVKRQAEERKQGLMWTAVITLVLTLLESEVSDLVAKAMNIFGVK